MPATTHIVDLDGPVHYADHGGDGPPLVMVHGLGGSHLNWGLVAGSFQSAHRVYAPDMIGFGLTPLAGRKATMEAQRELLTRFIDEVAGAPVTLMGNSMGGLISMLTAAADPERIAILVLVDPALPLASPTDMTRTSLVRLGLPIVPFVGPAMLRRYNGSISPQEQVDQTLELLCSRPERVGPETRAEMAEMVRLRHTMEWAIPAFTQAMRSITRVLVRRSRFMSQTVHRIAAPTLLLHGEADSIVAPGAAHSVAEARPDWHLELLPDIGHIPMIETPDRFTAAVTPWLDAHPALA
ncbi:MAG: alpha/beta fold hydrolase [Acidimicrobiia bacterium]